MHNKSLNYFYNRNLSLFHPYKFSNIQKTPLYTCHASIDLGKNAFIKEIGYATILGTSRKNNEDRLTYEISQEKAKPGDINSYIGVFDGHGGSAVSNWLEFNFYDEIKEYWSYKSPEDSISKACTMTDRKLLASPKGFFGALGERGVGGARCGASAAFSILYQDEKGKKLLAANIGDSRVLLLRNGKIIQLTEDHVPDVEEERLRIESQNPNPKSTLVRFESGTWRVGGVLALSRAFGDAFLKGSLQFEGIPAGSDNYSTGFGVIVDPCITITDIESSDTWLLIHSDGLNDTAIRGGGGGLSNSEIEIFLNKSGNASAETLANSLAAKSQESGSTDDVSIICAKLNV